MQARTASFSPGLWGASLVIAPLLFGASTFFWEKGQYGVTGGTILALSLVLWILNFVALFDRLRYDMPVYASIGLLVAVYGCVSGVCFAFVGVFSEVFSISHVRYLQAASEYPLSFNLLLFWPGPLFPLSLLVLGVNLIRKKIIPSWIGVLICLGAISFPVSRILRIEWVAHVSDLLLIIPLVFTGLSTLGILPHRGMNPLPFQRGDERTLTPES